MITNEHIALLEASLDTIENEYTPTCESASYGGCPGATDKSRDFWRRAVDCMPALLAELRERRSLDEHRRKSDEELIERRKADASKFDATAAIFGDDGGKVHRVFMSGAEVAALALLRKRIDAVIDCCPRHDAEYAVGVTTLDKLTRSGK